MRKYIQMCVPVVIQDYIRKQKLKRLIKEAKSLELKPIIIPAEDPSRGC